LKFGLKTRRHEKKGWLKTTLMSEGLLLDNEDDNFVDPRDHTGTRDEGSGGKFVSMKKVSQRGVPKGVFTIP